MELLRGVVAILLLAFVQKANSASFLFSLLNSSTVDIQAFTDTGQTPASNMKINENNADTFSLWETGISGSSFHFTASSDPNNIKAAVVYVTDENMGEAMSLIPYENLDKEYIAVTYCEIYGHCQISVASATDGTEIEIEISSLAYSVEIFPEKKFQRPSQHKILAKLGKYEALYLQCAACDLTGTKIISKNNKIAVVSGSKNAIVGYGNKENILMEQLPPVNKWGKEFAWFCDLCGDQGSFVRVVASEARTTVKVSGYKTALLTSSWKWLQCRIEKDDAVIVSADKPVMVAVFILNRNRGGKDWLSSMIIIPPTHQFETIPSKRVSGITRSTVITKSSSALTGAVAKRTNFPSHGFYADSDTTYTTNNKEVGAYMFKEADHGITNSFAMSSYKNSQPGNVVHKDKIDGDEMGTKFIITLPVFSGGVSEGAITLHSSQTTPTIISTCETYIDNPAIGSSIIIENMASCVNAMPSKSTIVNASLTVITSDDVVVLVTLSSMDKTAAYVALPIDALGYEYYAITYCDKLHCMCAISAEHNSISNPVNIEIFLSDLKNEKIHYDNKMYESYGAFTVSLSLNETFILASEADLTGTKIKGNARLSVVCGGYTNTGVFFEQIPPTVTLGTDYLLPFNVPNGMVKIVATDGNTIATIRKHDNVFHRHILAESGSFIKDSTIAFLSVNASKPILVMFIQDDNLIDGFMTSAVSTADLTKMHSFKAPLLSNRQVQLRSQESLAIKLEEDGRITNHVNNTEYVLLTLSNSTNITRISTVSNEGFAVFFFRIGGAEDKRSFGTTIGRKLKTRIENVCTIETMVMNDTKDNDCDGLIDEDICITQLEIYENITAEDRYIYDFDIDGLISEDCGMEVPEPRRCKCPCNVLGDPSVANMSTKQLLEVMAATKKQLTKNKTSLSSFIRKKISVRDQRPSSIGFGVMGALLIAVVVVALTAADVISVFRYIVRLFK